MILRLKKKVFIGALTLLFICLTFSKIYGEKLPNLCKDEIPEELVNLEFSEEEIEAIKKYKYIGVEGTEILSESTGKVIKTLIKGQEVQPLRIFGDLGYFMTLDGVKGLIKLNTLEKVEKAVYFEISPEEEEARELIPFSKINKLLKNGDKIYTLLKGEPLVIKEKVDNIYVILDEEGNEYKLYEGNVDFRQNIGQASRGGELGHGSKTVKVNKLMKNAYSAIGSRYRSGGTGPSGYDCSGLTYSLFKNQLGITLPRSSGAQANAGEDIKKEDLMPGDLVFFKGRNRNSSRVGHVGIYIGDNKMIHSSSSRGVIISGLAENYYAQRYLGAKRIIK